MNIREKIVVILPALAISAIGLAALKWWFTDNPHFEHRLAEIRNIAASKTEAVDIKGSFQTFEAKPSGIKSEWPAFRGPGADNISREKKTLAASWPEGGPAMLWKIKLGEGYAGPAVKNGRIYILDYDEETMADTLRCLSLDSGKEIWKRWYKVKIKRNHGMSRTVPAVTDNYVVTIGPRCQVMCVNAISGDYMWGIDLPTEFKTKTPLWYTGQCPIIVDDTAVIATGGSALMIGIDCATGKIKWQTPNPDKWEMSHSSVVHMTIHGKKMYVYCTAGGMIGVSAEKEDEGKLLWKSTEWNHSVIAPSPIHLGDGRIFVTAGYGVGSMTLELTKEGEKFALKHVKSFTKTEFACEQHTPIYFKDHIFTVMPADAGALKLQAVCMTKDGRQTWNSGKNNRFGIGPYLIADDKMLILDNSGLLTMIEARTDKYVQLAQHQVLKGHDAWGPMAIVDGKLLLRDFNQMACIDLANPEGAKNK